MGLVYSFLWGRDKDAEIYNLRRILDAPSLLQALRLCTKNDIPPLLEDCQHKDRDLETSQQDNNRRQSNIEYLENRLQIANEQLTQLEVERARSDEAKGSSGAFSSVGATPDLLQQYVREVKQSLAKFCRALLLTSVQMASKEAVDISIKNLVPDLSLQRSSHVKYLLESYISFQLFRDFENDEYMYGGTTKYIDKSVRSQESFQQFQSWTDPRSWNASNGRDEASARAFSEQKMDMLVISMSRIFGTYLPMQSWIKQECQNLLRAAWVLHLLAFSFEPPARIVRAPPMGAYDPEWMEFEDCFDGETGVEGTPAQVGVMTMPGFQVKRTCISCQIYPSFGV